MWQTDDYCFLMSEEFMMNGWKIIVHAEDEKCDSAREIFIDMHVVNFIQS